MIWRSIVFGGLVGLGLGMIAGVIIGPQDPELAKSIGAARLAWLDPGQHLGPQSVAGQSVRRLFDQARPT